MEASETGLKPHNMRNPRKGGFRAAMFVFAMSGLENIGFVANLSSLVLYFYGVLHFDLLSSANNLTNFIGSTFLLTLLGGFISDTYLSRLNTVLIFGSIEILGYILLTIQAYSQNLRPDIACKSCKLKGGNALMFYVSLILLALGFGGVRGAYPALGADQFDKEHPVERKQLASFFNWLLLSVTLGASLGVTVIVWVRTRKDWSLGFFITLLLAFAGLSAITLGKPFYRLRVTGQSPLQRVSQVIISAIRNRKLPLPDLSFDYQINGKDEGSNEERLSHTNQFRFLDKAILLPTDSTPEPSKVCSVTQVEEVKILIKMLPILLSTVLMNTCLAQLATFSVQQGQIMDLHLGSFEVPPASLPIFPLAFMSILVPIYEFIIVPVARRITGHPTGITHLQRVGIGLVLSAISMTIAGFIEVKRKNAFINHDDKISIFWLTFQFGIFGIADMFTLVGLMEFFYHEAPSGMRSLATSFSYLSLSLGNFFSSVLLSIIEHVTERVTSTKLGWLQGMDLNQNKLELFYWFLAIMSVLNFLLYLLCAKFYQYRRTGEHDQIIRAPKPLVELNGEEEEVINKDNVANSGEHDQIIRAPNPLVELNGEEEEVIHKDNVANSGEHDQIIRAPKPSVELNGEEEEVINKDNVANSTETGDDKKNVGGGGEAVEGSREPDLVGDDSEAVENLIPSMHETEGTK